MISLKKVLVLIVLFLFVLTLSATHTENLSTTLVEEKGRVEIIAHRGASGYAPENTMTAFERAVEMNVDYIELDVQLSKDGHLVVMHDLTLDRTTNGHGDVKDYTLEELKKLDAGSYFGPSFAGEQIPTLEEVLEVYLGKTGIVIEMKAPWIYIGMEKKLAATLTEYMDKPETAKVIVQSFDHKAVKKFKKLMPDIPVAVLIYKRSHLMPSKIKEYAAYASYVNPRWDLMTGPLVYRIHSREMKVFTWMDGRSFALKPYLEAGVDGIITDFPDNVPRNIRVGWWMFIISIFSLIIVLLIFLIKSRKT